MTSERKKILHNVLLKEIDEKEEIIEHILF